MLDKNLSIRVQTKTWQVVLRICFVEPTRVKLILRQSLFEVWVGLDHHVVVVHGEVWQT